MTNQEHTALINTLNDIRKELAGIRMEIEILRECNVETSKDTASKQAYWLKGYYPMSDVTTFRCTNCDHQISFDGKRAVPDKSECPKCKTIMIGVI